MEKVIIPVIKQASATELPYSDNYSEAVFIAPPYYDMCPIPIFLISSMSGLIEVLKIYIQSFQSFL